MQQHHQLRAYVRIPQVHLPIDLASHTMTLEDRLEMRTCRARVVVVGVVLERLREAHNIYIETMLQFVIIKRLEDHKFVSSHLHQFKRKEREREGRKKRERENVPPRT